MNFNRRTKPPLATLLWTCLLLLQTEGYSRIGVLRSNEALSVGFYAKDSIPDYVKPLY